MAEVEIESWIWLSLAYSRFYKRVYIPLGAANVKNHRRRYPATIYTNYRSLIELLVVIHFYQLR